jgi:hypothetical protein
MINSINTVLKNPTENVNPNFLGQSLPQAKLPAGSSLLVLGYRLPQVSSTARKFLISGSSIHNVLQHFLPMFLPLVFHHRIPSLSWCPASLHHWYFFISPKPIRSVCWRKHLLSWLDSGGISNSIGSIYRLCKK